MKPAVFRSCIACGVVILSASLAEMSAQAARTSIYGNLPAYEGPPLAAAAVGPKAGLTAPVASAGVLETAGPHHRIWKQPSQTSTAAGGSLENRFALQAPGGRVVELASGMNYWNGQQWAPSEPVFEPAPDGDGFIASRV